MNEEVEIVERAILPGEKYSLSLQEAAQYFSIGEKKLRKMAEENMGRFAVYNGNRFLILRDKFEAYLSQCSAI
ncbi:MAG: excisionase family DNA-binding protein [Parasporobacterium sp.]|nr:excisionase family DNA-binding protein [Parasporobacterium sp.]